MKMMKMWRSNGLLGQDGFVRCGQRVHTHPQPGSGILSSGSATLTDQLEPEVRDESLQQTMLFKACLLVVQTGERCPVEAAARSDIPCGLQNRHTTPIDAAECGNGLCYLSLWCDLGKRLGLGGESRSLVCVTIAQSSIAQTVSLRHINYIVGSESQNCLFLPQQHDDIMSYWGLVLQCLQDGVMYVCLAFQNQKKSLGIISYTGCPKRASFIKLRRNSVRNGRRVRCPDRALNYVYQCFGPEGRFAGQIVGNGVGWSML
jgi:hypothetical protein